MKYLMLINHAESYRSQTIPQPLIDAVTKFMEDGMKRGVVKDTAGLKTSAEGFKVHMRGGKLKVTDGPFTETKELVGGYVLFEVKSKEEAREFTRRFAELHRTHWPEFEGDCEVRTLEDM